MRRVRVFALLTAIFISLHFLVVMMGANLMWLFISACIVSFLWTIKIIKFGPLRTKYETAIEGLDKVRMLEIQDRAGSLFIKKFNSDNVSVQAWVNNDGRNLKMVLNPKDEEIKGI